MNQQQLEQQLRIATSRSPGMGTDEETESLRQSFAALGELLDRRPNEVDEQWLVATVLQGNPRGTGGQSARSEAWLAMAALAASVLLIVSLAATQFNSQSTESGSLPVIAKATNNHSAAATNDVDLALSWDDDWDTQLEEARDFAASYGTTGFLRYEATSWKASEALREIQAELNSM